MQIDRTTRPPVQPVLIRAFHPSDLPALYRVCHATGWNGCDASDVVSDPELIGHSYIGPYAVLEPQHCFVAVHQTQVVGYVTAVSDCVAFHRECETKWFPILRARYPLPASDDTSVTATFLRTLHTGHLPSPTVDLIAYPANLHIDLLPEAQGQGLGRRLLQQLFSSLRFAGVAGVHLYAGASNVGAIRFYQRIGFQRLEESEHAVGFGYDLR